MGFVQQPHSMEAPPSSPLSSRPELRRSVVERSAVQRSFPGNGFCSATTLNGSAALPFVISTGAPKERSGEICGPAVLVPDYKLPNCSFKRPGERWQYIGENSFCGTASPLLLKERYDS